MTRRKAPGRRAPAELGSVEQLPSGRWRAFYRREGRKFGAPHTFATKAEGRQWLATELADRARGVWRDPNQGQVTLEDFAGQWISSRPDLRPRTRDLYTRLLDRWILPPIGVGSQSRELGQMPVGDISPSIVRAWFAALHEATAESAKSIRAARTTHPARSWAQESGIRVAPSGRLSPSVVAQWENAGSPQPRRLEGSPARGSGKTTAAQAYRLLRTLMSAAVADGVVSVNPCRIRNAGSVAHRERQTATVAEVAMLAKAMPPHLSAAVHVAAWSGLRYGELFALARRHVSDDGRSLRVERSLELVPGQPVTFGPPKTQGSLRTVHLPGHIASILLAHLEHHSQSGPDALLFSTPTGLPIQSAHLSRLFRRARMDAGRPDLTWHDLRHTGATLAYAAGASVPDVQRRLGHSTMRAAQLYAHSAKDADRLLADRLEALTLHTMKDPK